VSSDGYERLLELVAENPGLEAEELIEMVTDEEFMVDEVEEWLENALVANDVIEFDDNHWVVRWGRFAYEEYDHPV